MAHRLLPHIHTHKVKQIGKDHSNEAKCTCGTHSNYRQTAQGTEPRPTSRGKELGCYQQVSVHKPPGAYLEIIRGGGPNIIFRKIDHRSEIFSGLALYLK